MLFKFRSIIIIKEEYHYNIINFQFFDSLIRDSFHRI